jgi:hypothetical protein
LRSRKKGERRYRANRGRKKWKRGNREKAGKEERKLAELEKQKETVNRGARGRRK